MTSSLSSSSTNDSTSSEDFSLDDTPPGPSGERLDIICPDCGSDMILRKGKYGPFYGCVRHPDCWGTHAAKLDGSPAGIPGDEKTRKARYDLIQIFQRIPKDIQHMAWICALLGTPLSTSKIGFLDYAQCSKVFRLTARAFKIPLEYWERIRNDCDGDDGITDAELANKASAAKGGNDSYRRVSDWMPLDAVRDEDDL
jgi:hypothetical protein